MCWVSSTTQQLCFTTKPDRLAAKYLRATLNWMKGTFKANTKQNVLQMPIVARKIKPDSIVHMDFDSIYNAITQILIQPLKNDQK